jgi:hypothetical protein
MVIGVAACDVSIMARRNRLNKAVGGYIILAWRLIWLKAVWHSYIMLATDISKWLNQLNLAAIIM